VPLLLVAQFEYVHPLREVRRSTCEASMIQLTLINSSITVQPLPDNSGKMLVIADPQSGIVVACPLPTEAARTVGAQLSSSLLVAAGPLRSNGEGAH
jgi:hypothetical protein